MVGYSNGEAVPSQGDDARLPDARRVANPGGLPYSWINRSMVTNSCVMEEATCG